MKKKSNKTIFITENLPLISALMLLKTALNKNCKDYHMCVKSILGNKEKDTVYTNGILTKTTGVSPRWLLFE